MFNASDTVLRCMQPLHATELHTFSGQPNIRCCPGLGLLFLTLLVTLVCAPYRHGGCRPSRFPDCSGHLRQQEVLC